MKSKNKKDSFTFKKNKIKMLQILPLKIKNNVK
jgi:hypothetical protein